MSTTFDPFEPAHLAELMPAIRMMARFPTRTTKVVSFETGVELANLTAFVAKRGRPTSASLKDLEQEAEGRTIDLGAKLGGLAASPPPREIEAPFGPGPARSLSEAKARVAAVSTPMPAEVAPPVRPWLTKRIFSRVVNQYLPLVEAMLADSTSKDADLCRRFNVGAHTFSAWKVSTFGRGVPPADELRAWLAWAKARIDVAPKSCGVNPVGARDQSPIVRPVMTLADLAGKERRHLVASVVCGLLAGRSASEKFAGVVGSAYGICAEIVRQDAHYSAPNGGAS
jgi:hypothetical protein